MTSLCDFAIFSDESHVDNKDKTHKSNIFSDIACKRYDSWGEDLLARFDSCLDLVAVEAVYHISGTLSFNGVNQKIYN